MGTILQFPQRNKGRIRKSTGPLSEGTFAMMQFEAGGPNVVRFDQREIEEVRNSAVVAVLVEKIINNMPNEARKGIKRSLLCDAVFGDDREHRTISAAAAQLFHRPEWLDARA